MKWTWLLEFKSSTHCNKTLCKDLNPAILPPVISVTAVTLHKYISQDESLFYARVMSGAVWHLTLRKISPSQDSNFGHMVQTNNVGVNF